ncbi:hypothetical protein CEUSTIGMA_g12142.t1 [Chlamydomonas eustigma]|uniref:Uncharacterized protein n=1 Tax=Chlamydomonas eustigma TaxID=1157962 RepID=A0A250XPJ4_9CHLO|nr:hypothetical protein CEUSTIGMA_g12142.t1 [Chlamydomonas eustigma]|eukprot:GAX84720.1 hypothetical protein CEUSTIGMA_g12142.t1 [Chlamydomonas eustigma]
MELGSLIVSKDARILIERLFVLIQTSKNGFKEIQGQLSLLMFGGEAVIDENESLNLILDCLRLLVTTTVLDDSAIIKGPGNVSSISHLLIELIAPAHAHKVDLQLYKGLASELVESHCLQPAHARLTVKIVQNFQLSPSDFQEWKSLVDFVALLLADRTTLTPAISLMMLLEGLDEEFDKSSILGELVALGLESSAETWINRLGKEYQVTYVEHCIAQDRLKAASRTVRRFGLKEEFPDVESMYRQKTVGRLLGKRLWSVASTFVGNEVSLQTLVLKQMVEAGEGAMAEEYRILFGLPPEVLQLDPDVMAREEAERLARYLQLPFPDNNLIMVDDEDTLATASRLLSQASLLGLDVEWKPFSVAAPAAADSDMKARDHGSSPASVLQV